MEVIASRAGDDLNLASRKAQEAGKFTIFNSRKWFLIMSLYNF